MKELRIQDHWNLRIVYRNIINIGGGGTNEKRYQSGF